MNTVSKRQPMSFMSAHIYWGLATLFIIPKMKGAWLEIYTRLLVLHCLESPLIWPSQTKPLLTEIGIHLTLESCDIQTEHKAGKRWRNLFPFLFPIGNTQNLLAQWVWATFQKRTFPSLPAFSKTRTWREGVITFIMPFKPREVFVSNRTYIFSSVQMFGRSVPHLIRANLEVKKGR